MGAEHYLRSLPAAAFTTQKRSLYPVLLLQQACLCMAASGIRRPLAPGLSQAQDHASTASMLHSPRPDTTSPAA